jgi:hypothetical protein
MNKKIAKWKIEEEKRISLLSNSELLEETISLAGGDDYDGCFTVRGDFIYGKLYNELNKRLASWLTETTNAT